jgi:hypothetical protein
MNFLGNCFYIMKDKKFSIVFFTMSLLVLSCQGQFIYSQLGEFKKFDSNDPPITLSMNMGQDFTSTKQFGIWGWFKPDFRFPMITNVLTLRNHTEAKNEDLLFVNYDLKPSTINAQGQ